MPRVLVVDDEPDLRFLVRRLLESRGYEVDEAPHGEAALERLRGAPADLVITDGSMPVLTGGELIRRIRADATLADLGVVFWSTNPDREAGADVIVPKPYAGPALLEAIERLAGERGGSRWNA